MPRESRLPPEWKCLEGVVSYVQRVSDTEFSSSCPSCGGEPHPTGEWPDRCRLFVDGNHPRLWCRRCNLVAYPDQFGDDSWTRPDPAQIQRWREEQRRREDARRRSAERALENLRDNRVWERYHEALGTVGRNYWLRRGIPEFWQDWWQLGWRDRWNIRTNDGWHTTPSASIPLFDAAGDVLDIKHRLVNPAPGRGKYRYELGGQGNPPFLVDREKEVAGDVIAVEGEIKAMVVAVTLDDPKAVILGMPGLTPGEKTLSALAEAEHITLVTDPGSRKQTWELVKQLGRERCSVLIPPLKIDDGILQAGMNGRELRALLKTAIPTGGKAA